MYLECLCFLVFLLSRLVHSVNCTQPHILMIVVDDYGWNDVGYHGSEIKTPNIDKLASDGVKLENYYVQPICSPTRSQLLSGNYQIHTGLQHFIIWAPQPDALPSKFPTIADKLKEEGYATHAVGKWHIGFYKKEFVPTSRGFDTFYGYLAGRESYFSHYRCLYSTSLKKNMCGMDFRDNMQPVFNPNGTYSAELYSHKVIDIVENHAATQKDKPLFIYLAFQSVHDPLQVPDHYMDQYHFIKDHNRRIYAGMVHALDDAIGNITDAFKRTGLWNNTLLALTTDNGGQVSQGGNNWPLKGWKTSLFEGGVRGVGFVHGNMIQKKGSINNGLMHVTDWFPTLLTLAGGSTQGLPLDGYNVWASISEGKPSPRKEILHNIDPLQDLHGIKMFNNTFDTRVRAAIRVGDWKLITGDPCVQCDTHIPPPHLQYKSPNTTANPNKNLWLYNIQDDPNEYSDLSTQQPDIVKALLQRLTEYNQTVVPCTYSPDDPNADPSLHGGFWGPWL